MQQDEEKGTIDEDELRVSITVDAGMKIEGNGNVVCFDGRKVAVGGGNSVGSWNWKEGSSGGKKMKEGEAGRKRRAYSVSWSLMVMGGDGMA